MTASSPESPPRRARPHRLRRLLVASGVAVLLVVGAGVLAYGFSVDRYQSNLSRVHGAVDGNDDDRPTKAAGVKAQNWLVVGSDSLASRPTSGRDAQKPLWRPGMQRTDTMMLVHLAGDGTTVLVTSIPRDSWVSIPGHGMAKINAAFSFGGPRLLVRTVEQLTGVRIDHYAAVDFAGFEAMTDAVGGVDVTIPRTVHDSASDKTWTKGRHHLDGTQALLYVRQRHGLPGGDLGRIRRQQNFLRALLTKAHSTGVLANPLRLDAFLTATTKAVTVDDTLDNGDLRSLAFRYRGLGAGDIAFLTAPVRGAGVRDGQDVLFLDRQKAAELFRAVRVDRVARYVDGGRGGTVPP